MKLEKIQVYKYIYISLTTGLSVVPMDVWWGNGKPNNTQF